MEKARAAMQAKREAFHQTLSEAQKTAYEEIFPAQAKEHQTQEGEPNVREGTPSAPDMSELTAEELSELETQLNSLLARLNVIE